MLSLAEGIVEGLINFKHRGGGLTVQTRSAGNWREGGEQCRFVGACCGLQRGAACTQALDQGWAGQCGSRNSTGAAGAGPRGNRHRGAQAVV